MTPVIALLQVLVAWPRVCMSRPYNLKYDGTVEWAEDEGGEKLKAWKEGRTGFPIVDAAMRSLKEQGCASLFLSLSLSVYRLVSHERDPDPVSLAPQQTCTTAVA